MPRRQVPADDPAVAVVLVEHAAVAAAHVLPDVVEVDVDGGGVAPPGPLPGGRVEDDLDVAVPERLGSISARSAWSISWITCRAPTLALDPARVGRLALDPARGGRPARRAGRTRRGRIGHGAGWLVVAGSVTARRASHRMRRRVTRRRGDRRGSERRPFGQRGHGAGRAGSCAIGCRHGGARPDDGREAAAGRARRAGAALGAGEEPRSPRRVLPHGRRRARPVVVAGAPAGAGRLPGQGGVGGRPAQAAGERPGPRRGAALRGPRRLDARRAANRRRGGRPRDRPGARPAGVDHPRHLPRPVVRAAHDQLSELGQLTGAPAAHGQRQGRGARLPAGARAGLRARRRLGDGPPAGPPTQPLHARPAGAPAVPGGRRVGGGRTPARCPALRGRPRRRARSRAGPCWTAGSSTCRSCRRA